MRTTLSLALTSLLLAPSLTAQEPAALLRANQVHDVDSGSHDNATTSEQLVYTHTMSMTGANWLQIRFGDATLPEGSYIRLTGVQRGFTQRLDIESLVNWHLKSAQFAGDTVRLDLMAGPNTFANQIIIKELIAGQGMGVDSICGPADNRTLSNDDRMGRLDIGCTGWMVSPNIFLTAGHCVSNAGGTGTLSFNVPLSSATGSTNPSHPDDQYPFTVLARQDSGIGADWAVCRVGTNSNTGLLPTDVNGGQWFQLNVPPASTSNQTIRITGYGSTSSPVSPTWNLVQKTHSGPFANLGGTSLGYVTDTTGGNSGSPVFHENSGTAIGIHSHGGCSGGWNSGTRIDKQDLAQALAAQGIGLGIVMGTFSNYGSGCETSITPPAQCAELNPNGGNLQGLSRSREYAYQATASSPLEISSFEIYSRSTAGFPQLVVASIYGDNNGAPDLNSLGQTTVFIGSAPGFYQATFSPPVSVPPGTFYLGVDHSAQSTAVSHLTSGASGTAYSRSPALSSTAWSVDGQATRPSFRVTCNITSNLIPAISGSGNAAVNSSFTTNLRAARPNAFAALLMGFSDTNSGPTALPFNLGGFGAPQCDVLVDPQLSYGVITDGNGEGSRSFTVPNDPGLLGLDAYQQWFCVDRAANGLGFVFSPGMHIVLGG